MFTRFTFNTLCGIGLGIFAAYALVMWLTWRVPKRRRKYRDRI